MSKEIKEAMAEIALGLREQVKFYAEIGISDLGNSGRNAEPAHPSAPRPEANGQEESLAPEPFPTAAPPVIEMATKKKDAPPGPAAQTALFGDLLPVASKPPIGLPVLDLYAKDASLEAIRADIGDCTRCRLHEQRTKIVYGEGNPQAELMFVGEGPGADEDLTGRPFVGRAGQLLDKIIAAIGKKRDEVYIANIVKCRPPQNRTPERDEVETCQPFLFRQIAVIRPKVIVALGSPAFQCLFNTKEPISRARGEFRDWNGIQVMPTFHPAYLLRSPDKKREAWEDMKKVRDYLSGLAD